MVWRVGDGRSIHIWDDKWLPTKVTHVVQSPIRFLDEDAKVSKRLMNTKLEQKVISLEGKFQEFTSSFSLGFFGPKGNANE